MSAVAVTDVETYHYTGREREAARHLLRCAPAFALQVDVEDRDGLLTVCAPVGRIERLSCGERHLWLFLVSLGGGGSVNVWAAVQGTDDDCQRAMWGALGTLIGVV